MERFGIRNALIFVFRKTSFTLGLIMGFSFFLPLLLGSSVSVERQFLMLPVVLAVFFLGVVLCGRWAESKFNTLTNILYNDCDPDRFLAKFMKEVYSRKSEEWRGITLLVIAQAYHAQGRFKEEEALFLQFLNNNTRSNRDDAEDIEVLARLTILYGDAQNAAGAKKAFKKFKEKVLEQPPSQNAVARASYEELKDFVYNSYLMGIGKFDECVGFFEWHSEHRPKGLPVVLSHYRLAEVYRALGSPDEAEREYRTVAESGRNLYAVKMSQQRLDELGSDRV